MSLELAAPPGADALTIRFREAGKRPRDVRLEPGRPQTVTFDVCSRGVWHVTYTASALGFVGTRVVSARASEPRVTAAACSTDPTSVPAAAEPV